MLGNQYSLAKTIPLLAVVTALTLAGCGDRSAEIKLDRHQEGTPEHAVERALEGIISDDGLLLDVYLSLSRRDKEIVEGHLDGAVDGIVRNLVVEPGRTVENIALVPVSYRVEGLDTTFSFELRLEQASDRWRVVELENGAATLLARVDYEFTEVLTNRRGNLLALFQTEVSVEQKESGEVMVANLTDRPMKLYSLVFREPGSEHFLMILDDRGAEIDPESTREFSLRRANRQGQAAFAEMDSEDVLEGIPVSGRASVEVVGWRYATGTPPVDFGYPSDWGTFLRYSRAFN